MGSKSSPPIVVTQETCHNSDHEKDLRRLRMMLRAATAIGVALRDLWQIDGESGPSDRQLRGVDDRLRVLYREIWTEIGEQILLREVVLVLAEKGGRDAKA